MLPNALVLQVVAGAALPSAYPRPALGPTHAALGPAGSDQNTLVSCLQKPVAVPTNQRGRMSRKGAPLGQPKAGHVVCRHERADAVCQSLLHQGPGPGVAAEAMVAVQG